MTEGEPTAIERFESALREGGHERYVLRLFVAGLAPSSTQAISRVRQICERHLEGRYDLEIIDVHQQPERVETHDVFAIPTLLKELPLPLRRIIGDLSDEGGVLLALGVDQPVARDEL